MAAAWRVPGVMSSRGRSEPPAGLAVVSGAHGPAAAVAVPEQRHGPLARHLGQLFELRDVHRGLAREVRGELRAQALELARGVGVFLAHTHEPAEEGAERLDLGRSGAEARAPRRCLRHGETGRLQLALELLERGERVGGRLPWLTRGAHALALLLDRAGLEQRFERSIEQRGVDRALEPALQVALRDPEARRMLRGVLAHLAFDRGARLAPACGREPAPGGG